MNFLQSRLRPVLAGFLMMVSGCSESAPEVNEGSVDRARMEWPEFERFAELLREVAGMLEEGRKTEVLLQRNRLLEAAWAVNLQSLPSGANNGETLRQLLGDLSSKVNRLAVPSIDETVLTEVVSSLRPIVAEIDRTLGGGR